MDKTILIKASPSLKQSIINAFCENKIAGENYQIQNIDPFIVKYKTMYKIYYNNKTIVYKKNGSWTIDKLVLSEHGGPETVRDGSLQRDAKVIIFGY